MHRQIKIDNITWDYEPLGMYDEEFLGTAYVGIPGNMMKRFVKECAWDDDIKVPPHYFQEDLEADGPYNSDHECYNTDTQIVLMNWLHNKRRNYNLPYRGQDPFWIFHDHCHSKSDVYGYEVSGIYSYVEYQRILEGAEMAKDHGILIQPKTAIEVLKGWRDRFHYQEEKTMQTISERDFLPFFEDEQLEEFEFLSYSL